MTPAGIEPATFRFVAQHLNHCATDPRLCSKSFEKYATCKTFLFNIKQQHNESATYIYFSVSWHPRNICVELNGVRHKHAVMY